MIQWIILVGVRKGSERCSARLLLVAPCGSSYHVGSVFIFDDCSEELCKRQLVVKQLVTVFTLEHVPEERVVVHQVGLQ